MKFSTPGIILIVLGVIFLLRNLGLADIDFIPLLRTWWPLILVAMGVSLLLKHQRRP